MEDNHFKFNNSVIALPLFFVLFLWFVFWLEVRFNFDFAQSGILPRTFSGLQGVILSPFIHSNMEHLYNNSIPLLVLLAALRYFYCKQSAAIIIYGILLSGLITWVIGRSNYHIGASGLLYVLVSFVFFKGLQTGYYRLVALSLAVIVIYGGMIWYVFPKIDESTSWEGHLGGLISGFALTFLYKTPEYKKVIKYDWEDPDYNSDDDKFMQRFDEEGNFVNNTEPEEIKETSPTYYNSDLNVKYQIIENKKEESKPAS